MAWFVLSGSPSQRANTLLKAIGCHGRSAYDMRLGPIRYLTSARHRAIIKRRDRFTASTE